jgi:HNH endonuclease
MSNSILRLVKEQRFLIKAKLSEAQNHHCCFCGIMMTYENGHHNSICIERIDFKDTTLNYFNLVAACYSCSNRRNAKNAFEYYAQKLKHGRVKSFGESEHIVPKKYKSRWRSNPKIRRKLSEEQNHRCCYCGQILQLDNPYASNYASIEHIVPREYGGSNDWDNLAVSCMTCNNSRPNEVLAEDYYEFIKTNGQTKKLHFSKSLKTNISITLDELYQKL